MEPLQIAATKNTPNVAWLPDLATFRISGNSIPENASEFYGHVMAWLERNITQMPLDCSFEFSLPYFNSSSLKAIYLLLLEIKKGSQHGKNFRVYWYAEQDDEFMTEAAETFIELTSMNIEVRTGILEP